MYRRDFWTLWEKARVGCFERTACILSIVKQITSPGGMHETGAQAWCTGKTQRDRVEWEGGSGWGIHVTPWLVHVNVWQNPLKRCEVISLQLIKINGKKKKKKPPKKRKEKKRIHKSNRCWREIQVSSFKPRFHPQMLSLFVSILCPLLFLNTMLNLHNVKNDLKF